ncbi:MAG: hypothetical protein A3I24_01670 [Candidatus Harrisonbacteria bacterium RIFCSPLOWO2_02_FULL_41_13b]|uniref:Peptidoglycan binding-like domain-containing protein n=2 Tax=Parcubacteria group TaxID=1794811 RepID=A0A1F8EDY2_9BACT|nr:MAG: hypothetical protein A2649_00310 [Candidatus Yanofskybacteria bacterium RIFCSPHIGHO2_01_FULL_41_26]OGY68313.1 MAG: hypothetical protein A3I24_01670 [Candidatus Harrisonbacteria bacterium RIFCSPLOWO2_02_FULL_41_13b]
MTQGFRYPHLVFAAFSLLFLEIAFLFNVVNAQIRPEISVFSRNLAIGIKGEDVRWLQRFLNSNPETRVAETGVGSFGQETDYFGVLTRKAVIQFQNKHKNDVLIPVGLLGGTGFVGPRTIAKLNKLFFGAPPGLNLDSLKVSASKAVKPRIDRIVPESGFDGAIITIYGEGFTKENNTLHNIFDSVAGLPSSDGKTLVWKFEEPEIKLSQAEIDVHTKGDDENYNLASKEEAAVLQSNLKNVVQPVMFYIENVNGSSNVATFKRTFNF